MTTVLGLLAFLRAQLGARKHHPSAQLGAGGMLLPSSCIDLGGLTAPELSLWYHMYGLNMGSLHIDIIEGSTTHADVIPAINGDQGDIWKNIVVDLSSYANKTIQIQIRGITGAEYTSDIAIDDISITAPLPLYQCTSAQTLPWSDNLDGYATCTGNAFDCALNSCNTVGGDWKNLTNGDIFLVPTSHAH